MRSLALLLALIAVPVMLSAQATKNQPRPAERPSTERPAPTSQRPTAEPGRSNRPSDRQATPDRGRPPARSTGEPELRRRKP